MKYVSINELLHFDFHDSVIERIDLNDDEMIWLVSAVNALSSNSQNNHDDAMCIESAAITFENVSIESIVTGAYTVHQYGKLIESHEEKTVTSSKYNDILRETVGGNHIHGLDDFSADNNQYSACFNIDSYTETGNYFLTIKFTKVIVQWENFNGKAWYATDKWKNHAEKEKASKTQVLCKITPKHVLNGFLYLIGITVYYNITIVLLIYLANHMNAEFESIYVSALPLSFVSQIPLVSYKLKNTGFITVIPCYILTVLTLLALSSLHGDSFNNIFLPAVPLTLVSGLFLVSYKFWEWIKGI